MKSKVGNLGVMTYAMAVAFGLPLGTVVANNFADASWVSRLAIMLPFFMIGAVIGYLIDQPEPDGAQTDDRREEPEEEI